MKKYLTIVFLALATAVWGQQAFVNGIRLGVGQSKLDAVDQPGGVLYFTLGAVSSYRISPLIDLNAEGLLTFEGSEYSGVQEVNNTLGFQFRQPYRGDFRVVSFKIPLYPALGFGSEEFRFRLQAGPSFNLNLYAFESRDYEDENVPDTDKQKVEKIDPFSVALLYGAGVRLKVSEAKYVFLDVRYSHGLSVLYETGFNVNPAEGRLRYFSISAGYLF